MITKSRSLVFVAIAAMSACATQMTPSQFLDRFPRATNSRYIASPDVKNLVDSGACRVRVANRKYSSPIGLTVNGDLQGGAKGVDEWVAADGGNAYVVNTFEWVTIGDSGATQLVVTFDTLLCT